MARRRPRSSRPDSDASPSTIPGFGLSRPAPDYDFRPSSHSAVVERLVDRLGAHRALTVLRLRLGRTHRPRPGRSPAGAHPCPGHRQHLGVARRSAQGRLFSALMGGPLSPLLVERLNLMLRLYLPLEPQTRPIDRPGARRVRRSVAARSTGRHAGHAAGDRDGPAVSSSRSRRRSRRWPPSRRSSSGRIRTRGSATASSPAGRRCSRTRGPSTSSARASSWTRTRPEDVSARSPHGGTGRRAWRRRLGRGRSLSSTRPPSFLENVETRHPDRQDVITPT